MPEPNTDLFEAFHSGDDLPRFIPRLPFYVRNTSNSTVWKIAGSCTIPDDLHGPDGVQTLRENRGGKVDDGLRILEEESWL